jgi:hypothetical protein
VIVAGDENKLKLGKGNAFVKSQLHRLRQEDETWEVDFRALPKPISQSASHYLGMVLTQPDGFLRADVEIDRSPTVNDLATLLAHAMKRPLVEGHLRPRRIHLRGNPKWKPLFRVLPAGVQNRFFLGGRGSGGQPRGISAALFVAKRSRADPLAVTSENRRIAIVPRVPGFDHATIGVRRGR